MIVKQRGEKHFTIPLGPKAVSDRVLLPGKDACRVKVTVFRPRKGFEAEAVSYPYDETVIVEKGLVALSSPDGERVLGPRSGWHVPAGEEYSIEVLEDSVLVCLFSQAGPDGPLPNDE